MNETPNVSPQASLKLDLLVNRLCEPYEVIAARVAGQWFPRGKGNKARKRAATRFQEIVQARGWHNVPVQGIRLNRYAVSGRTVDRHSNPRRLP